ncbi:gamma-glutamyltranspeptidase [Zoogloea oryzae]|uniref:Gamma-glutamyltranspeptidase n=1 Tax=Zoogloea oryzae TaxID=310767 RepID=A0ABQ6FGS9_9RHOO|nr:gamma-glutamyltransferase family protein [Zoogloea oryzae]GLT24501.1 gamma-glutamyltranspeptidase [Zoogloea oryzae]
MRLSGLLLLFGLAASGARAEPPPPEIAAGFEISPPATGARFMAVTANPHATEAAVAMLRQGGSALDAAIAAQMVLGVVEPQSSGIGGGGLLMHFDVRKQQIDAWDGRETAPLAASTFPFTDASGAPLGFRDAVRDPRAVGTPGLVAMLAAAHAASGRLPWAVLFEPAIRLAEDGFAVSPRLHRLLAHEGRFVDPALQAHFFDADGRPLPVGHRLRNPALADSLRRIAAEGTEALRCGPLAEAISDAVRGGLSADAADARGLLGQRDLLAYAPIRRSALCRPFRDYRVCGFPPPSSGATTVLAMLGIWQALPAAPAPDSTAFAHRFAEAGRLAYADRAGCVGDPAFRPVPVAALLDARYLARRAVLVGDLAGPARRPAGIECAAPGEEGERPSTTHLSIVDGAGNAVALTSSIEDAFGNRRMAGGFLLNNQLTDFSTEGANRLEPGKRPRSSMAPTLVFDRQGRLYAVLGSPGGSQIPNYVAQALLGLLEGGLSPAQIVSQPRLGSRNGPTEVERGRMAQDVIDGLRARGHALREVDMTSGIALVVRGGKGWIGAADPRREGRAGGE